MRAADSLSLRLQKQGEGIVHQLALLQRDAAEQRNGGNDLQLQLVPRNGIDIFFREQICEIFPDKSALAVGFAGGLGRGEHKQLGAFLSQFPRVIAGSPDRPAVIVGVLSISDTVENPVLVAHADADLSVHIISRRAQHAVNVKKRQSAHSSISCKISRRSSSFRSFNKRSRL